MCKKTVVFGVALLSAAVAVASPRAPLPVVPVTPNERSVAFWVKFDALPSVGEPTGVIGLSADADGLLTATWKAQPTCIQGDLAMISRDRVAAGEWHHVEARYSLMEKRVSFYLDGRFQWENDSPVVPMLAEPGEPGPAGFRGEVAGLRTWDFAADSERMAVVGGETLARRVGRARAAVGKAKGLAKSAGLVRWCEALAKRCDEQLAADRAAPKPVVTVHEAKALQRDAEHALAVAEAGEKGVFAGCASFVTDACSQTPILPYDLPVGGEQTDEAEALMSPDEYETLSWTLLAFDRLEVKAVKVGALTEPGGAAIPAANVDVKLVKRWFRTGLAWISYMNDECQRTLVPDLLVNDDSLIYVDEERERNYLRLDYPEGSIYSDVSDPASGHRDLLASVPFKDAETVQPFTIAAAGRNQQIVATVHVTKGTKPGVYRGAVTLETSAGPVPLRLSVRVLPIDLPVQPSPYMATNRVYVSLLNRFPAVEGFTQAERVAFVRTMLESARAHNLNHFALAWHGATQAKMAREAGFIPDRVFDELGVRNWMKYVPNVKKEELGADLREKCMKAAVNEMLPKVERLRREIGPDVGEFWTAGLSEDTDYVSIAYYQREMAETCSKYGLKLFAHGMGMWNAHWAGEYQDMNSSTLISREEAHIWHAAGGEMINYADPFPSAEAPSWFRRRIGLMMYKAEMDGHMLHGFRGGRVPFNEWAEDPHGDGAYRNFCMCYPMQGGAIFELCLEGVREAYDDLRYLTRLTVLALERRESADDWIRREAKRALLWIESIDGEKDDMNAVRIGAISRIMTLTKAEEVRK